MEGASARWFAEGKENRDDDKTKQPESNKTGDNRERSEKHYALLGSSVLEILERFQNDQLSASITFFELLL